jgi:hypothetical protein
MPSGRGPSKKRAGVQLLPDALNMRCLGNLLVGIGERKKDGISAFYVLEHNPGNIPINSTPIYGGVSGM